MITEEMLNQIEERFIEECRMTFNLFKNEIIEKQKKEAESIK